jgi:hypothetical protein
VVGTAPCVWSIKLAQIGMGLFSDFNGKWADAIAGWCVFQDLNLTVDACTELDIVLFALPHGMVSSTRIN